MLQVCLSPAGHVFSSPPSQLSQCPYLGPASPLLVLPIALPLPFALLLPSDLLALGSFAKAVLEIWFLTFCEGPPSVTNSSGLNLGPSSFSSVAFCFPEVESCRHSARSSATCL